MLTVHKLTNLVLVNNTHVTNGVKKCCLAISFNHIRLVEQYFISLTGFQVNKSESLALLFPRRNDIYAEPKYRDKESLNLKKLFTKIRFSEAYQLYNFT